VIGVRDYASYLESLNSSKFEKLLPAQAYVLSEYARGYAEKCDIGVELPTGAGKTLIALLTAGTWLEAGRQVVILSANKTLARQMQQEANALNLPVAYMEGRGEDIPASERRRYQRAQAIGIMNYWVYFNQNPVVDPARLVVMDDAHLAEHCLHSLYSVEITKTGHPELFRNLVEELRARFPQYGVLADALADDRPGPSSAELLSFLDQSAAANRIREIVDASSALTTDTDLNFRWGRLRGKVHQANLYLSADALWLRPYVYPLTANEHYERPDQVLYMSATIGDPGDLARRLGVRPITKIPVPPSFAEQTFGRRLIVMNRTNDDADIPTRMQLALLQAIKVHPKSVWLCASGREARHLRTAVMKWLEANSVTGHPTWLLTSQGQEIDEFKRAPAGHLFVAGRFDGMDFRHDECRVVVLGTLPRAINLQEEFIATYLRDAGFMRRRLNQRLVQALGRCNRAADDFGVYFLADQRFATHFSREANREGIPANITAEIDLAQDLAEKSDREIADFVSDFLGRRFDRFDAELAALRADVPPAQSVPGAPDTSADEVVGWAALFSSENYPVAEQRFRRCGDVARNANLREIAGLHGWHEAKALHLAGQLGGDAAAAGTALTTLGAAIERGGVSSWFNRMRASLNRARNASPPASAISRDQAEAMLRESDDRLERYGNSGPRFQKFVDNLTAKLSSVNHDEYAAGVEELGRLLGYRARRPKHKGATDGEWRGEYGNAHEVVTWEAKIEHAPSNTVTAADLGQAHNQHNRAVKEFGSGGYTIRSLIVTHMDLAGDAVSSIGPIRIVRKDAIIALWERVKASLTTYRSRWSVDDVSARAQAADQIRPLLPPDGWLVRAIDKGAPYVTANLLVAEWK
jgi:hypothetical protein